MNPHVNGSLATMVACMALCSAAIMTGPPSSSIDERDSCHSAVHGPEAPNEFSEETTRAPVLFSVSISPEARVKATAREGSRELQVGNWTEFSILIENAAGITAPLDVESKQQMTSESDADRDHWLRLTIEPSGPLTGAVSETRVLRLFSRDTGIRTAILNVNAGQGTQDLGFRSDVVLSFRIEMESDSGPVE